MIATRSAASLPSSFARAFPARRFSAAPICCTTLSKSSREPLVKRRGRRPVRARQRERQRVAVAPPVDLRGKVAVGEQQPHAVAADRPGERPTVTGELARHPRCDGVACEPARFRDDELRPGHRPRHAIADARPLEQQRRVRIPNHERPRPIVTARRARDDLPDDRHAHNDHAGDGCTALLPELEEAAAWRSGTLLLLDSLPNHADLGERTALVSDPAATVLMFAACTHPDRMLVMSFTLAGEIVDEWSSKRMQIGADG